MSASTADWAVRYIEEYQFRLVAIPKGTKGPLDPGWNLPGRYVTDPEVAWQRWNNGTDEGIGVVLGPSGVCSADIDFPEHAERVLGELGIETPRVTKDFADYLWKPVPVSDDVPGPAWGDPATQDLGMAAEEPRQKAPHAIRGSGRGYPRRVAPNHPP